MLFRIIGLLLAVALLSLGLSWYFSVPVLGLFLKLIILLKSLKWAAIGLGLRNATISVLTKTMPGKILTRVVMWFTEGLGLNHMGRWVISASKGLFRATLGRFFTWMNKRGFGTRLAISLLFSAGVIWLSIWSSVFWLLFIWMPAEMSALLDLALRAGANMLAKTGISTALSKLLAWLMETRLGRWLKHLDEQFEAVVKHRVETHGRAQRMRLAQSRFGRSILAWLDRFAPELKPPRHRPSRNPFAEGTIRKMRVENAAPSNKKLNLRN